MKADPIPQLWGVILCGGQSRRMGRDKGSLLKEGEPWVRHMIKKIKPFGITPVISVQERQLSAYASLIAGERSVVDALDIPGPLNGLLSVHAEMPQNDLLLLACDMLDLDEATIGRMIDTYRGAPAGTDFFVYQERDFAQPFCGIYKAQGLAPVYDKAVRGGGALKDFSLQSVLDKGRTMRIKPAWPGAFENYNTL